MSHELYLQVYRRYIKHVEWNPNIPPSFFSPSYLHQYFGEMNQNTTNNKKKKGKKVTVGFMSKFFGIFEPHGMLLDGIMKHLPRSRFISVALSIARTDGKPLNPTINFAADEIVEIPLSYNYARELIEGLDLDILVFADTMSEPMTHFLAHSRISPLQFAFWGNPITSGSRQVDYFISADGMEHQFRTRIKSDEEPYIEQIVLLEGQGIWYNFPERPEISLQDTELSGMVDFYSSKMIRQNFEFGDSWFIYFCPQSVFKIHPLYDFVLADILISAVAIGINAHLGNLLLIFIICVIFHANVMRTF